MEKRHQTLIVKVVVNFVFFIIFFLFFRYVSFQPGDDEYFIGLRQQIPIGDFLLDYYRTWSGRIFSNFLVYVFALPSIFIWRVFMALVMTIFGRILYFYFSMLLDMKIWKKITLILLCYLGVFLFSSGVLIPSVFWYTGSLNYVVPVVFALIAYIPFLKLLKLEDERTTKYWRFFIIPIMCVALSNEQVSIAMLLITSGTLTLAKIRKIRISSQIITLYVLLIAFTIVSIAAPGNWVRLEQETQVWFSEHSNFNLFEKITLALGFSLTAVVNQWYYLMALIWSASAFLLITQSRKWSSRIISVILFFYALVAFVRFITSLDFISQTGSFSFAESLFSFSYLLGPKPINGITIFVYLFWSLGLLLLPLSWILTLKKNQTGLILCFLLFVVFSLLLATGFSPTLFASGGRTGFVPNVLMLIILISILTLLKDKPFQIMLTPTVILILFKMATLLYRWTSNGYFVDYGLITMQNIFQH